MRFTLSSELAGIVRPGVLWLDGATVVERDPRLNAPLAAAEAAVRANPPAEVTAVRTMYKRVLVRVPVAVRAVRRRSHTG